MDVLFSVELETCATFDRGACAIIDKKKLVFHLLGHWLYFITFILFDSKTIEYI